MRDFKQPFNITLRDESATQALASNFVNILDQSPIIIFLRGDLGAGKTCFTRYLLQTIGIKEKVKSPTYTIVETYSLQNKNIYHFDLYRAADPSELEMLGIRDYLQDYSLLIVEWAEKGYGFLPPPDLEIALEVINDSRNAIIKAITATGQAVLQQAFNI